MTLYEELGVPPDATPDAIREAYRNAARLLHPDAQTNPVLKESAEVQMKRINHLYEVLSDPQRRRGYDHELARLHEPRETIVVEAPLPRHSSHPDNRGTIAWLAATAICAAFVVWLATRESPAPVTYPHAFSQSSAGAIAGASMMSPLAKAPAGTPPDARVERQRADEVVQLRAELAAANEDRARLMKLVAAMEADRRIAPAPQIPRQIPAPQITTGLAPPSLTPTAPAEVAIPVASPRIEPPAPAARSTSAAEHQPRLAGSWAYHHPQKDKITGALFPPEFIETVISEENGLIRGQYHARFKVGKAKISPDVDFRFEGRISGTSGRFAWFGTGGAKGEVRVRLVSDTALEVVWAASSLGSSMGLASGTAVLDRKN